jgi:hypothetical protein
LASHKPKKSPGLPASLLFGPLQIDGGGRFR